jgi:hypothetical protein
MTNTLSKKIDEAFILLNKNKELQEQIERKSASIMGNKSSAESIIKKINERQEQGETLENPFLDYCVYHFSINAQDHVEKTECFCQTLESLSGEKILIMNSQNTIGSQIAGGPVMKFPKKILLGRLTSPAYTIDLHKRNLIANVENANYYNEDSGWENPKSNQKFPLDRFLNQIFKWKNWPEPSPEQKAILRIVSHEELPQKKGIDISIRDEMPTLTEEIQIGKLSSYEDGIISQLIIGTERIDSYLEKQDLGLYRTEVTTQEIPAV